MVKISNFISEYEDYLTDTESPKLFRTWGAVACVAGVLERRVWIHNRKKSLSGKIYPTHCIFHIAPTGVGKAPSVKLCQEIWDSVDGLRVGSESMTAASFYDEMAGTIKQNPETDELYSPLVIATEEISSFFIQYDHQMLGAMLKAVDCSRKLNQSRRTVGKTPLSIEKPSLTALFAGQPSQFNDKFPEAAYGLGFMGRSHIVYSDEKINVPFFCDGGGGTERALESLIEQADQMGNLCGEIHSTPSVRPFLEEIQEHAKNIEIPHPRLEGYYQRRPVHLTKLALVKAISHGRMTLDLPDVEWALALMVRTEAPAAQSFQVFKQDNDAIVMHNLMHHLWEKGKKTVNRQELYRYLEDRVAHIQIPILIATMEAGGRLKKTTNASIYAVERKENFNDGF